MIEINLVPPEYRKKKKKGLFLAGMKIPVEVVIGSIGGLFMVLILVHISLLFINITKLAQRNHLQKSWEEIKPEKESVDVVINKLRSARSSFENIKKMTSERNVIWAKKLNILSDQIPRGVWFKRIALSDDILYIEGSAISKERKEMINVHGFTSNLKNDKEFLEDFHELELGSIQRRRIQNVEIADFLLTSKLK